MAEHDLIELTAPGLAYITFGGFVVAFSMLALLIKERLYMSETIVGLLWGVALGPYAANIFDPRSWGKDHDIITLEVMRVVLATGLFATGVDLPKNYMWKHRKGLSIMIIPTMAIGWVTVAGVIRLLFPTLSFISALAVAACLTPTDPIISAAIVGGNYAVKNVPLELRHLLAAESAANDGLAYPFLTLAVYLTMDSTSKEAIKDWILIGWLYEVGLGIVLGAVFGLSFSYLMRVSHEKGFINRESFVAQYLALAFLTIGVADVLGVDDLLAAFACGNAISWNGHFNSHTEDEIFFSVIDLILNCGCFVYIGAWMPFTSFNSPELGITPWRLVILFIIILAFRRIPSLLLLYRWIPEIHGWKEALFSGHFGPMGVGAVFVSTFALTKLPKPQSPPESQAEVLSANLQPIVAFIVLCSILIHGLSIPFLSLGRKVHSRTVSLKSTFTNRADGQPDWLLWARRVPAANETVVGAVQGDIEAAGNEIIEVVSTQSSQTTNTVQAPTLERRDTEPTAVGVVTKPRDPSNRGVQFAETGAQ